MTAQIKLSGAGLCLNAHCLTDTALALSLRQSIARACPNCIAAHSNRLLFVVLPLVVSIDSPLDSPLTANKSNAVSCTSYGSSPPAVISWWLDGIRLDHQDSQVSQQVIRPQVGNNVFTRFSTFSHFPTKNVDELFLEI